MSFVCWPKLHHSNCFSVNEGRVMGHLLLFPLFLSWLEPQYQVFPVCLCFLFFVCLFLCLSVDVYMCMEAWCCSWLTKSPVLHYHLHTCSLFGTSCGKRSLVPLIARLFFFTVLQCNPCVRAATSLQLACLPSLVFLVPVCLLSQSCCLAATQR